MSSKTGQAYNNKKNGGFEIHKYKGQATGPGLVLIEGGTFTMGNTEQNITYEQDNIPRRVTVASFYMDETEVSNADYREYLHWIGRTFGQSNPEVLEASMPDTTVWRRELAFNEPLVENYFRHPSYQFYPVVGVTWKQANEYCIWRTDRVNEEIMAKKGYIKRNPNQTGQENFNTESYYAGLYEPQVKKQMKSFDPNQKTRKVKKEDGITLPAYRLPTEAEWEYAAMGLVGNSAGENISDRKVYPWNGHSSRYPKSGKYQGDIVANFKRGRGDYMGVAGKLNDAAAPTAEVYSYPPNDYGLYNMAGNVNEWVLDLYRPLSFQDAEDFNTYRGNVYTTVKKDADGLNTRDSLGRLVKVPDTKKYTNPDVSDYLDTLTMYNEKNTLISNKARVYKGGSWRDYMYWLSPGTRRFLDENESTDDIGFRCAMIRVGSPKGKVAKRRK
jgi:gliding motility-associated lipoprotein GldJ